VAKSSSTSSKREFRVRVEGLAELAQVPEWIERGQRVQLELATERIGKAIADGLPGGARGKAGRQVDTRTLTSTKGEITVGPIAKALSEGAYIGAKRLRQRGRALRIPGGQAPGFTRRPFRIKGNKAVRKGLGKRGKILRDTFGEVFDNLERLPRT
jgi:hypothetical protein